MYLLSSAWHFLGEAVIAVVLHTIWLEGEGLLFIGHGLVDIEVDLLPELDFSGEAPVEAVLVEVVEVLGVLENNLICKLI